MVNSSQKWQRLDNSQIRISLSLEFLMFMSGFHCQVLIHTDCLMGYKVRFSQQALTMVICSFQNLLLFKFMGKSIYTLIYSYKTKYSLTPLLPNLKYATYKSEAMSLHTIVSFSGLTSSQQIWHHGIWYWQYLQNGSSQATEIYEV